MIESKSKVLSSKMMSSHNQVLLSQVTKDPLAIVSSVIIKPLTAIRQFQDVFLYGNTINILHKGRSKQMYVYLDNNRQKFLWISSKTKAFLLDLYFTSVHCSESSTRVKNTNQYYLTLKQFQDQVTFIFLKKEEQQKYFNLFTIYIDELKGANPKYTEYFSLITRTFALQSTKNGSTSRSQSDIIQISSKIGLANKKENQKILNECCKFYKVPNKKEIPFACVNEYFKIQFCSRNLQKYFEQYSQQKLGEIENNPRLILKEIMSLNQFKNFLRKEQREDQQAIEKITEGQRNLSFFDFCLYIYDKNLCSINRHPPLNQNHPLNDYFCYSSHNTYLSGNQLTSDCQVQRYTEDLQNGIKCVELDVHNDGYVPIVTHAVKDQSLCKPILFSDVIKQVDRFSQQNQMQGMNHYPIILSIENHATEENRERMLNILTTNFNKNLYYVEGQHKTFPTLNELKGKIVIKTSSKQRQLKNAQTKKQDNVALPPSFKLPEIPNSSFQDSADLKKKIFGFYVQKEKLQQRKMSFDSSINNIENLFLPISSMAKITSIFKAEEGIKTIDPSSFVCTSLTNAKVLSKKPEVILNYSKGSWLRTYPQGSEVGSGNYDPAPMFNIGAQIIALNTQTKDDYAWMTYGYFCGGKEGPAGEKGYVLKPDRLRLGVEKMGEKKTSISIKIIQKNSHKLKIKFYGVGGDGQRVKVKEDSFVANEIENLDQSFVIYDIDDDYRQCVALRFITPGFRILSGRNRNNYHDVGIRIVVFVTIQ